MELWDVVKLILPSIEDPCDVRLASVVLHGYPEVLGVVVHQQRSRVPYGKVIDLGYQIENISDLLLLDIIPKQQLYLRP